MAGDVVIREDSAEQPPKPLKTFRLQVTAAAPQGVADASELVAAPSRRRSGHASPGEECGAPAVAAESFGGEATGSALGRAVDARGLSLPSAANGISHARGVRLRAQPSRRTMPACSASVAVHGLLLAMLAMVTINPPQQLEELILFASDEAIEEVEFSDTAPDAEPPPAEPLEQTTDEKVEGPIDPGTGALGMDDGQPAAGPPTAEGLAASLAGETLPPAGGGGSGGPLGDLGSLFGDGNGTGGGRAEFGTGLGAAPLAKFFGAEIEGRRIVFVLDNSGSMQGGRLETVIEELLRCVDSLTPKQEFYVIFYSDAVYPLFYPEPANQFVRATDANKQLLAAWLETVELCTGDAVAEAVTAAAMIEPDVVFLLSDGRIHGDRKMQYLLSGGGSFKLHTVGIAMGSSVTGRHNLEEIAAANNGDFREAHVPEEMRMLAQRKPRAYHVDGPGPVWGRNVRVRSRR